MHMQYLELVQGLQLVQTPVQCWGSCKGTCNARGSYKCLCKFCSLCKCMRVMLRAVQMHTRCWGSCKGTCNIWGLCKHVLKVCSLCKRPCDVRGSRVCKALGLV